MLKKEWEMEQEVEMELRKQGQTFKQIFWEVLQTVITYF